MYLSGESSHLHFPPRLVIAHGCVSGCWRRINLAYLPGQVLSRGTPHSDQSSWCGLGNANKWTVLAISPLNLVGPGSRTVRLSNGLNQDVRKQIVPYLMNTVGSFASFDTSPVCMNLWYFRFTYFYWNLPLSPLSSLWRQLMRHPAIDHLWEWYPPLHGYSMIWPIESIRSL